MAEQVMTGSGVKQADSESVASSFVMRDSSKDSKARIWRALTGLISEGYLNPGAASAQSSDFTAGDAFLYVVTTGAADKTATLPAAATAGVRAYFFVKDDAGAGKIVLDGNASETVNGATTHNGVATQWKGILAICDGTEWYAFNI